MKKNISNYIRDNEEFIDNVAITVMKEYVRVKPPTSFADSLSVARVSYKQALAMLEVKENGLLKLLETEKIFQKQKRIKDDSNS